jgi:hypothetical protein
MLKTSKRLFIQDFIGICNRLEALVLAFAIRKAHGHQVFLDWPELDALEVIGTRRGGPGLLGRLGAVRVRQCDERQFAALGARRNIILRTFYGPEDKLAPRLLETAGRLRIHTALRDAIRRTFEGIGPAPVVGIHLRRGDFDLPNPEQYDARSVRHPAVPLWWYEFAMDRIIRRQPSTRFLLCRTGDSNELEVLKKNFDVREVDTVNPYAYKGPGHQAQRHPVADLFALACCPAILVTPVSSFSHYAANVLGPESICLGPAQVMSKAAPSMVRHRLYGRLLPHWFDAGREQTGAEPVSPELDGVDLDQPARHDWIQVT